jgi:hypothetical protein
MEVYRSAAHPETRLSRFDGFTVLELSEPPSSTPSTYNARLTDSTGKAVWRGNGVSPDREGTLALALPPTIPTGSYRLIVEETDSSGRTTPAGDFAIRVD